MTFNIWSTWFFVQLILLKESYKTYSPNIGVELSQTAEGYRNTVWDKILPTPFGKVFLVFLFIRNRIFIDKIHVGVCVSIFSILQTKLRPQKGNTSFILRLIDTPVLFFSIHSPIAPWHKNKWKINSQHQHLFLEGKTAYSTFTYVLVTWYSNYMYIYMYRHIYSLALYTLHMYVPG